MIQSIEIIIKSGINYLLNVLIDYEKKVCYKDNKEYKVTDEFLDEIIRTIRTWKKEYGNDNLIDSEEFKIIIGIPGEDDVIHGKGVFPENYAHLKELIGDLHD